MTLAIRRVENVNGVGYVLCSGSRSDRTVTEPMPWPKALGEYKKRRESCRKE